MRLPLKHINRYRDRHGRTRYYFRPPGSKNIPLPGKPGEAEFLSAYNDAAEGQPKQPIGATRNAAGSVAQAVSLYLESATFGALAPDTRRTRKNELERFRIAKGVLPIALMERRHVEKHLRGKSPVSARNCLKALAPFMVWCVREDLIPIDQTASIERPRSRNKEGYATWPEEFVERYRARHPTGAKARLALELLVNTGAARVDVVRLGRQHVRDGFLCFRRHKTDVLVEIPVLDGLGAILANTVGDRLTFLMTEYGKPFSAAGFGNWFRERCNEAGIPLGYSAHGVRKYAAVLRANNGATVNELMSWFGWMTEKEAAFYTRQADRRRLAVNLGHKMNAIS